MSKDIQTLADRIAELEKVVRDMHKQCPCLVAKLAALKDQPTRRDIELRKLGKHKREGER